MDVENEQDPTGSIDSSSDAPFITMMKSAEPGQGNDYGIVEGLRLDKPAGGRLFAEIVMGSVIVVIGEVFLEDALEMPLVQSDRCQSPSASGCTCCSSFPMTLDWAPFDYAQDQRRDLRRERWVRIIVAKRQRMPTY